jgi:hypothetical protein
LSRARDGARAELELRQQEAEGAAELQASREERLQRANTALREELGTARKELGTAREELGAKERALAQTNVALDTARAALVAGNQIWQESVAVSAATAASVTDSADAFAAFAAKPLPSTPSRAAGAPSGTSSRLGTPGGGGGGGGGGAGVSPRAPGAAAGAHTPPFGRTAHIGLDHQGHSEAIRGHQPTPPFGRTAHMSAQELRGYKEEAARGLAAVQAENVAELESVRAELSGRVERRVERARSAPS